MSPSGVTQRVDSVFGHFKAPRIVLTLPRACATHPREISPTTLSDPPSLQEIQTFRTHFRGASVQRLQDRADIASIGLEMGGCVIVGYLIGDWVDGRFELAPWGTAFFLLCGFGAAVKGLIRVVKRAHALSLIHI